MGSKFGWLACDPPGAFVHSVGLLPVPILILLGVILLAWLPFRSTVTGRGCYAVGSSAAGCGGRYLALQTGTGNASIPQSGLYTSNSIATVAIGRISMFGGSDGLVGSVFGTTTYLAISFCFRVFDQEGPLGFLSNPLLEPIFEGVILLFAVSVGAARAFRVKN